MNMKMMNKFKGTLMGCAIGDTLGMPVEIWNRDQIKKYWGKIIEPVEPKIIRDSSGEEVIEDEFGKLKYWFRGLSKGDYTDDTILTLALAKSLLEKGFDLDNIAKGQLDEYLIRQRNEGQHSGGFGGTTRDAFERLKIGISPLESGVIGGPGNAPAMKMSPVGLYMYATGKYEDGIAFSEKIGKITHLDPRSVASGVLQAHATYIMLNDIKKEDFIDSILDLCKLVEKPLDERFTWYKQGSLLNRLEWIKSNKDADIEEAYIQLGVSSAVYKSYPFALFMVQKYWNNPIEGLVETVNFGGDCDTTGAIYGALIGAKNGIKIFPNKWIETIKNKENIMNLSKKLYQIRGTK